MKKLRELAESNYCQLGQPTEDLLCELEVKYEKLVWYARKPRDKGNLWADHPRYDSVDYETVISIQNQLVETRKKYPEAKDLDGEHGDFTHGFNSGMLACVRLLLQSNMWNAKDHWMNAVDLFPSIDS